MILLCPYPGKSQPRTRLQPLTVGDRVPDITFKHILNAHYTSASLSSLTNKLVLVDFWATWCSACIREFPKLDSLQTHFKDRLQVLLVSSSTSDDVKGIQLFFKKHYNPAGKKYALTAVVNDVQLGKLFPHISLPHIAWIYKGKVIAITDGEEITTANIEAVLDGEPVKLELKEDVMDFDAGKPLLTADNGGDESALLRRSLFTRYLKGMGSRVGLSMDADSTLKRLYIINQPILKLYAIATPGIAANRLLLETKYTGQLIHAGDDNQWKRDNFYSYELTVPATTSRNAINAMMRQDLDRQFNLYSRIERRKINCYALVRTGNTDTALKARSSKTSNGIAINKAGVKSFYNQPMSALIEALNYQVPGEPLHPIVLDETNYSAPINLDLPVRDKQDIESIKIALHPYGLDIIPVSREVPMLIISAAKPPSETTTIYSPSN